MNEDLYTWPRTGVTKTRYVKQAGRQCTYTYEQAQTVMRMLGEGTSKMRVAKAVGLPRHTVDNIHRRVKDGKPVPAAIIESVRMDQQTDSPKNEGEQ